jgi:S-methylmethionine-dependent homocysteine/selenocysteine methylase
MMTKSKYRENLPQHKGQLMLTDGGMETTLIFHDGIDLPYFASFDLLRTIDGKMRVKEYYRKYSEIAVSHNKGFVLETPTWRANKDWADLLGYSEEALAAINTEAVEILGQLREEFDGIQTPFAISGNIGPRGDGYDATVKMTVKQAEEYHRAQIKTFANTEADLVTALTINYVEEAIGIVNAAKSCGMPVVISLTVETDGCLPTGQALGDAINQIDFETRSTPEYFMINCAHPSHFDDVVRTGEGWAHRIGGLRANASCMSHAELDNAEELDDGNPVELGEQYHKLMAFLPNLVVMGGCCGTDHRHIEAIAHSCIGQQKAA